MELLLKSLILTVGLLGILSCNRSANTPGSEAMLGNAGSISAKKGNGPFIGLNGDTLAAVSKAETEWKAELSPEAFQVLRQAGTEYAFTGAYWDTKEAGLYTCAGCGLPLFSSASKFSSGTGWPSFREPFREEHVKENIDNRHGMTRVEVLCGRCGGHLGHVFEDGPRPTRLRYCINSVSLDFVPKP